MQGFKPKFSSSCKHESPTEVPNLVGAPGWQQDAEPMPQQAKIIQLLKNHTMP